MFSVFDIFKIGLGPSSSHTTGPMRIAKRVLIEAKNAGHFDNCTRIMVELMGSLALTGIGHGTINATIWGLMGFDCETIDKTKADNALVEFRKSNQINLLGDKPISFNERRDIDLRTDIIPDLHPNGMCISLYQGVEKIYSREFYSTGGGFIASREQLEKPLDDDILIRAKNAPFAFTSANELLDKCQANGINIAQLVLKNEDALRPRQETDAQLVQIWEAMNDAIQRGLHSDGILSGGLNVNRRAKAIFDNLMNNPPSQELESLFDWLNVYAMATNEENANGGRVVTAPTNGASGLIPALIKHYCGGEKDISSQSKIGTFLLTAGAIGMIYKQRASLSGAEMGCQGEVGVACSMGAAGLCAIWGGTPQQIEHAAEIGMEHNLGLTCDPVGGLVQIPCIERNAIGAVKAANAARLALLGDGNHKVTLDQVIETMRQTGLDMSHKYKETSLGGLAVNVVEC
jgi:L-serine dehydratase